MRMKNGVVRFCLILFVLINASGAFAAFECIYMMDADGHAKTTFDWDDQPYLYLKLPDAGYGFTSAFWIDPDVTSYFSGGDTSYKQEVVLTLNNWGSVRKVGDWYINALYWYPYTEKCGTGQTLFTVVPEPSSIILFFIGIAFFAADFFRKLS